MPAAPKTKSQSSKTVIVWNRGRMNNYGVYTAGVWTLNYQVKHKDGRPSAVIQPIMPGLDEIPRTHWEIATEEAKGCEQHALKDALKSGRLSEVDLSAISVEDGRQALDQTASKALLTAVANGKTNARAELVEHAAELIRNWHAPDQGEVRKVTRHFASFARVG